MRLQSLFFSVLILSEGLLPFHDILPSVIVFYKIDNLFILLSTCVLFKIVEIIDSDHVERVFGG